MQPDQFTRQHQNGEIIVDCRQAEAFSIHIPGALNVGLGSSFATWAGTFVPADSSVLLVLDRPDDLWDVTWQLLRIGYPPPAGWLAGGMLAWRTAAKPLHLLPQWSVWDLQQYRQQDSLLELLDVR
ncbi:MAG: rhodanese-like domain-containing protein [Nitrospirales bacterium]